MVADDGPRETIRRNMKYERIAPTLLYRDLQQAVVKFLTSPARDKRILDRCHADLEAAKERATNPTMKENATYALRSLDVFEQSLNRLPIGGVLLKRAPIFKAYEIEGVKVSIQPTVLVEQRRPRGKPLVGALIVDTAKGTLPKTPEAERKLTDGMTHAAYLLHELVSNVIANDNEKPSTCPASDAAKQVNSERRERINFVVVGGQNGAFLFSGGDGSG